ncbi:transketolase, partial [Klebsiella pneumoniae]|nr:transketolase [Klebsiella pneumoniae]
DKSVIPRVTDIAAIASSGNEFAILFEGTVLEQASEGYEKLVTSGKKGKLIHVATLKPFNQQEFYALVADCPQIATLENHTV